jgi:hypothetical protein
MWDMSRKGTGTDSTLGDEPVPVYQAVAKEEDSALAKRSRIARNGNCGRQ